MYFNVTHNQYKNFLHTPSFIYRYRKFYHFLKMLLQSSYTTTKGKNA